MKLPVPPPAPAVTAAVEKPKPDHRTRVTTGLVIGGAFVLFAALGTLGRRKPAVAEETPATDSATEDTWAEVSRAEV